MKLKTRSLTSFLAMTGIATFSVIASGISSAQAATISSLYSTGAGLADGATDTNYTVTGPGISTTPAIVGRNPAWAANTSTSAWIGPTNGPSSAPVGDYVYTTTFNLTGFDASSAVIDGTWWTDNSGTNITLNGNNLGFTNTGFGSANASSFNIGSGFVSGLNTLSFLVTNAGTTDNPTGIQVQLAGTANLAATSVPEPADLLGTTLAFGSVVMLKRKMTKKAK